MNRKLRKVFEHAWIGGVCAGIAYWLAIPVWIIRLVWVVTTLGFGTGLVLYFLLWIFMPVWEDTPKDYEKVTGD